MALAKERLTPRRGDAPQLTTLAIAVAANVVCYAGGIAVIDAGYASPGRSAAGLVAVGRFEKTVDNTGGSAGDKIAEIRQGVYQFKNSAGVNAITQAHIGQDAWIVDDETVANGSGSGTRSLAGKIVDVDSVGVWVELRLAEIFTDGLDIHLPASADLSTKQFYFVKVNGSGKLAVAGAGEFAVGVLQNKPAADGAIGRVRILGLTKVVAGVEVTPGAFIASGGAGKAKVAVAGTTKTDDAGAASDALVGSHVQGQAISAAALDGDTFFALLLQAGAIPTTAA